MTDQRWRTLKWRREGNPFVLRTVQQLQFAVDKLILRAARSEPILVEVYVPEKGWMRIGLGQHLSVLSYRPENPSAKDRPRVSDGTYLPDKVLWFKWCDAWQGYERRRMIDMRDALYGLEHFFKTGELAPDLEWVDWEPLTKK